MVEKELTSSNLGLPETLSRELPDPKIVRALKKGFTRLVIERYKEEKPLLEQPYNFNRSELEKINGKYKQRMINLFRQSKIEYWPFHEAVLDHEKIEKEKTQSNKIWSKSGLILNWIGGIEEISGYSGD